MGKRIHLIVVVFFVAMSAYAGTWPGPIDGGYNLPNGWRITPVGTTVPTEDMIYNVSAAPDGKAVVALACGFNQNGLTVIDPKSEKSVQTIPLPTAFLGLAWEPDGTKLYVSGGSNLMKDNPAAPIYVFNYKNGRLSGAPVATISDSAPKSNTYWSGLVHHPKKNLLYAANRQSNLPGETNFGEAREQSYPGYVAVFDTTTGKLIARISVEMTPYDLAISADGKTLYVSNWGSDTISVIDTESSKVRRTYAVGDNPNDMALARDGRLFVACANDNTVNVIDTKTGRLVETIVTSLYPNAPEGSTPNAMALDPKEKTLYVANADNNNVCVIDIDEPGESTVLGFIPSGWYPSALAVDTHGRKLFVGNSKGVASYSDIRSEDSPLPPGPEGNGTVKSLQKGSVNIVDIRKNRRELRRLTKQAYANCPYHDELLATAKVNNAGPSVVPREVGAGSPIKHVLYIIKENRTYDQVLGDLPRGKGDPRLAIFGRDVTPNEHAIAETYSLLDNLYCDAEVSWDGHQWSNAAYATDYAEKIWPSWYAERTDYPLSPATRPKSGYLWDQCARKGLTYRSYGEFAERPSKSEDMSPLHPSLSALIGHTAPHYLCWGARDSDNAKEFIREFDEFEKNYDDTNPKKRLPNFMVMALPEDHTFGTGPESHTPRACVASNDYGLGLILERVSHSRYWPEMAVFVIEDDAQAGPDHIDARRTIGFVASPYCKRGVIDSTLYTTCSMLRTIELLLGLQPMSQYDAAANPIYASFSDKPDLTPYNHFEPTFNINEMNMKTAWGSDASQKMDFSGPDRTPMFALNEIVWKSVKGADSEMPVPVHRFHFASVK